MESLEAALAPYLQPLTSSLPAPLANLALSLLGSECYNVLLLRFHISHTPCVKLAISKVLGVGIIGASSVVKIPQLLKLLNSRSASGVSFLSYALETAAYLVTLAYNVRQGFPFSTYGETALIAVQNVAIAVAVLHFSGADSAAGVYVAALAAAGYALFSANVVDAGMLGYLQAGAGLLGVASKVPQIATVWREGETGQLSAFAVFNYLVGSLTRIFTTLQEVDDKLILYGFISGFVLNAVLAAQMVYYWNSPASKKTESKKLTNRGKEAFAMPTAASQGRSSATATPSKSPSTRRRG
ncbi:mannose-P-dolichol utilization defect 1 protein [Myriangium duriaei CBS 260.36]|uniref:Mannose-P-dolichol utilization defect 1 protein homolog n=1 Tax=Myriangium duriaei CBS 260.36 TaxID=1168546 RepID=A0A9P4IXU0_9PEZI|nr:mannose-P-dolichol utilization defect 1 protein [Myriangium duriaei CBS 260.36]